VLFRRAIQLSVRSKQRVGAGERKYRYEPAGGITAGIDFGLRVAAELRGEDYAGFLTPALEYDPQPPFGTGVPEKAAPAVEKISHSAFDPLHAAFRKAALEARKKWVS
jgi:cyclohexyl-isocyanide hydratase